MTSPAWPRACLDHLRARWLDVSMGAYYVLLALTGLSGLLHPSLSIRTVLGDGSATYSALLVTFAALGLLSVLGRTRSAECVVLVVVALLTLIHGYMLLDANPTAGLQTGLRLIAAPFAALPLAAYRWRDRGVSP